MNHDKQSSDCIETDSKQESKVRCEAYPACGVAVDSCLEKILFAVLENGKFAVADRIGNLGVRKLMGDHWTGVTLAVDFELRMILENELEHCKALDGDHFVETKQKLEWFQEMAMEQIFEFVRLKRFLELRGVLCEVQKEDNCLSAPGNLERSGDGDDSFSFPDQLRGGMMQSGKVSYYNKAAALEAIAGKQKGETSVRGGAGGAATTARKQQIRDALKEMSNMVNEMPDTQPDTDEDAAMEKTMADMVQLAENWKSRRPSKELMKERLSLLIERLDKSIKVSAVGGRGVVDERPKQSFYDKFPKLHLQSEDDGGKSSGKGKGKNGKGKDPTRTVPRFDLKRVYPSKSITSWHLILRSLEEGQMPVGEVAICDSVNRVAEIQALAQVHELDKAITLVAKAEGKESELSLVNVRPSYFLTKATWLCHVPLWQQ